MHTAQASLHIYRADAHDIMQIFILCKWKLIHVVVAIDVIQIFLLS